MSDDVGWQDHLAGHRMAVDREFADRVRGSEMTRQQWGLVMTAVEFEVEHPGDDARAHLVADTSKLDHVLPTMTEFDERRGAAGAPAGQQGESGGDASGFFDRVRDILGGDDGGGDDDLREEAERLADEYADRLQQRLESENEWERIRRLAAGD